MIEHKNVHEAILGVMQEVGYVQKQKSPNLNYSYAGEAALIAALRPAMIEHGLYCYVLNTSPTQSQFTTAKGSVMNDTMTTATVRFVHAPSASFIDVQANGEGMDTGDKSVNKASTGALKYALRQTFLIETGDDPDSFSNDGKERASQQERKEEKSTAAKRQWTPAQSKVLIDNGLAKNEFGALGMLNLSNLPADAKPEFILDWGRKYRSKRSLEAKAGDSSQVEAALYANENALPF